MDNCTILIADDDPEIRQAIGIYLTNEGMTVCEAADGAEALRVLNEREVQLIIMDIMMPNMDGIQAILSIRREREIPIIILSAKSEDADVVLGLNIGADDYITKPFRFLELIARVKSNLRRYMKYDSYKQTRDALTVRGLHLNRLSKQAYIEGAEVRLTPIEFGILEMLMENAGVIFSIDQIYERVWGEPPMGAENTVAVHIRRIREKIEANPKNPVYLKVVWGIGYKIEK